MEGDPPRLDRQVGWEGLSDERQSVLDVPAYKVVNDRTNDITTMKDGKIVWTGQDHRLGGRQVAHGDP